MELLLGRRKSVTARGFNWTGCWVIADDEVFLMSPDEPASLDDRYFGPIPSVRSSAKPSQYRPSRSCSAAIPVQGANENSSARLLHPPLFPANSPCAPGGSIPV
jgi:hypothetical protein